MKNGTRVALAVGAGYLLGRRRKMRMALMLGGAAMAGGLGGGVPGQLLRRGTQFLGSADMLGKLSPGLGEVTGMISDELLPVGKAAAKAAVSSQINALSDRVHERAEALRNGQEAGEEEEEPGGGDERKAVPSGRDRRRQRFEDEDEDRYQDGDEEEAAPARTARPRREPARAGRRPGGDGQRRDRREDEDEDEDMPVRAAGSRAGAPVRRVRR